MSKLAKRVREKGINIGVKATSFLNDKKGSPGVEEAALLLFIGLVVAGAADGLGTTINATFTNVRNALEAAIGI